jgi:hypothetical protein
MEQKLARRARLSNHFRRENRKKFIPAARMNTDFLMPDSKSSQNPRLSASIRGSPSLGSSTAENLGQQALSLQIYPPAFSGKVRDSFI